MQTCSCHYLVQNYELHLRNKGESQNLSLCFLFRLLLSHLAQNCHLA